MRFMVPGSRVIDPIKRLKTGRSDFRLTIKYGNPWDDHTGLLGVRLLWHVNGVFLDGTPLDSQPSPY